MNPTVTIVQFNRPVPPYHAGERAGFPADVADAYVRAGAARVIKQDSARVAPETIKERQEALRAEREIALSAPAERKAPAKSGGI
ncbi:MAG: hypothetical protein KGL63_05950 [Betaproteobacteria bacterium]|nr:hypothetical protein [Betaproteobacteria bacterium]